MIRFVTLTIGTFLIVSGAFAQQTRFVDEAGVDTGDCTNAENPCATIGFAVDQAESGDIIDIATGAYTESIMLDKSLTLQGAGRDETIIQAHEEAGQAKERVITISGDQETEIVGVTIRHGRALDAGGPESFGGGIYNDGGSLTIEDVEFESNEANLLGGGLYNVNSSPAFTEVVFTNNVTHVACSGCGGGGLYHDGDSITLDDVTFEENTTASNGGGILTAEGSSLVLTNASFEANTAGSGGGVVVGGTAALTHVTFHNNEAGGGGGVFTAVTSSSILTDVTFTENSAESGGGMHVRGLSTSILTDVEFAGNSAQIGGGMHIDAEVSSALTNVTFTNNLAHGGGGMSSVAGEPTLENVVFSGNEAEDRGGGFHQVQGSAAFSNVVFFQNTAGNDGGGIWIAGDDLTLTNVVLWGNTAGDAGGGILDAASLTATNVTIGGNHAAQRGGGLFIIGSSSTDVFTNSIVWGNTAGEEGNDIFNFSGPTELFYSLYSDKPGDVVVESGEFETENSLTEDPLFVDLEGGNLRLTEDSPAIDAGDPDTDLALFPVNDAGEPIDLDGEPRIFGDLIDIGSYERQGTIDEETSPDDLAEILSAPSPNPVRGSASLTLRVTKAQNVTVEVYDALGRRVQTLFEGALPAGGGETLTLDASTLPAGLYAIRAAGVDFTHTRPIVIVH